MSTSTREGLPPPRQSFMDKCKEQPLVPIGALTTALVLCGGLAAFKRGNKILAQHMMRARVLAQFGTLAAMVGYAVNSGAMVVKVPSMS